MTQKKITLKYGKLTYDIQLQQTETIQSFQSKIYSLTTVPPKNMRILNKSIQIKDQNTLHSLKQGTVLILFGTKQSNIVQKIQHSKQPQTNIPKQTNKPNNSKLKGCYGLINVGNTCYINSVIQFLKVIPQLKVWLFNLKFQNSNEGVLINLFAQIIHQLQHKKCNPSVFVSNFLYVYQQLGPFGQQQDAQEFLQKLLGLFQKFGKVQIQGKNQNIIKKLFQIEFEQTIRNTQLKDQQIKVIKHFDFELRCAFGDNQNKIRNIDYGIQESLYSIIEKRSDVDNQLHKYQKISYIKNLPQYLIIQFVRFYWKQSSQYSNSNPCSAKICRMIQFNQTLDLYDFCTQDLKIQLNKGRQKRKQNNNKSQKEQKQKFLQFKSNPLNINKHIDDSEIFREFKLANQQQYTHKFNSELYKQHGIGLQTGQFQLISLITHRGQTLKGGHYMAWSRRSKDTWVKFNDDLFKQKKSEELQSIRGGLPSSQMVYMLLYRRKQA